MPRPDAPRELEKHIPPPTIEVPCKICGKPSMPNWLNLALCLEHAEELVRRHSGREADERHFGAYFWLISAAIMWIITCVDGVLEAALGSTAYAWAGLLIASLCLSAIAAGYIIRSLG